MGDKKILGMTMTKLLMIVGAIILIGNIVYAVIKVNASDAKNIANKIEEGSKAAKKDIKKVLEENPKVKEAINKGVSTTKNVYQELTSKHKAQRAMNEAQEALNNMEKADKEAEKGRLQVVDKKSEEDNIEEGGISLGNLPPIDEVLEKNDTEVKESNNSKVEQVVAIDSSKVELPLMLTQWDLAGINKNALIISFKIENNSGSDIQEWRDIECSTDQNETIKESKKIEIAKKQSQVVRNFIVGVLLHKPNSVKCKVLQPKKEDNLVEEDISLDNGITDNKEQPSKTKDNNNEVPDISKEAEDLAKLLTQ